MELDDYISALETEGSRFSAAISATGADAPIPTCPPWVMRDLVHHQGEVHRWAATVINKAISKPSAVPDGFVGPLPSDQALADWFTEGHTALLDAIKSADPDIACFTFLADPPRPLVFWARRQTHETGMHRVDSESAIGTITPFDPAVAADGIDEMLTGFAPRSRTPLHSDSAVTLQVAPDDAAGVWTMTISTDAPTTVRAATPADCTLTGAASDLHRALWNRADLDAVTISGDPSVVEMFRSNMKVRWG
jgi:uncharacterized protein (TIGR03083 family)